MQHLIRPVTDRDIAAIAAIYGNAVLTNTATFDLEPPSQADMAERVRKIVADGYPYLVAERGRVVAGYAYASLYRPRIGYRYTVEDSIYIAADARGAGLGRALLAELITASEQAGYRQMVAVIGDSQNLASIRLHAGAGFVPAGNLKNVGYKFGRWIDTVFMQRALGPGADSHPAR